MVEEHVDHVIEEVGVFWREEATFNLVNSLFQLGEPVIVELGVVPGGKEAVKWLPKLPEAPCAIPSPHPFLSSSVTSSTLMPKMNRFSSPASSAISTLAPSMVPMVRAPFSMNFMLPVPEASVPAVEICSDRSVAGITANKTQGHKDADTSFGFVSC